MSAYGIGAGSACRFPEGGSLKVQDQRRTIQVAWGEGRRFWR